MTLLESAQALQPRLAELRREFHSHPEVSGQEEQTAARVFKELEEIGGYEIRTGISGHGILAELKGAKPGPVVALRADMDALMAGVQLASSLQTIVSRNTDPLKSAVITLGHFCAGTRYNIVPGDCEIEGTCRTFDPEVRNLAERRMKEITEGICAAMGCTAELKYECGYCAVMNDPEKALHVEQTAASLFGPEKAVLVDTPSMCAEDFGFYLTEKPGAFAWLGTGESEKPARALHNCHFTPNEDILWRGAALLAQLALSERFGRIERQF